MIILGIETSCDETAAAILEADNNTLTLRSNIVATSLALHAKTGGVIPEIAARQQLNYMLPVITNALHDAHIQYADIDAIAVTYGPGLIGSLLVGVETAKTLAFMYDKPVIPVNHTLGHIYANFISKDSKPNTDIRFPALALVVSGGHTDLLLLKNHGDFVLLGGTRDDAAGEAFDKIGRLIGLTYPGGPAIEKAAITGDPTRFHFPRPLYDSADYDFSFSGLKTAVLRDVKTIGKLDMQTIADLSASVQQAIIDVLLKKTLKAAQEYRVHAILLSGGVAANQTLRQAFEKKISEQNKAATMYIPEKSLCTDNAAMIAAAGYYNNNSVSWKDVTADPELYFE